MASSTTELKNLVLAYIGTLLSGGTLVFETAADAEVATLTLSSDSGNALDTPSGGSATFKSITEDSSATGGEVTKFSIQSSGAVEYFSGTVTESGGGGDIIMSDTTVSAGATVSQTSLTMGY